MGEGNSLSVNLALHDVISGRVQDGPDSVYAVDFGYLRQLVDGLSELLRSGDVPFDGARLYFDDNYESAIEAASYVTAFDRLSATVSVPITTIGSPGRCSLAELRSLSAIGVTVSPHGFSHTWLASYDANDVLLDTPRNGIFGPSNEGRQDRLTVEQVRYQLSESKQALSAFEPKEFVLPYGVYNQATLEINHEYRYFEYLTTCDPFLDNGMSLRPRLLVTSDFSPDEIVTSCSRLGIRPS